MPFWFDQTSLKSGDLAQVSQFESTSSHQLVLINSSSSGVERKLNSLNNILIDLCVLISDHQLSGMLSINSNVHEVEGSIPSVSTRIFFFVFLETLHLFGIVTVNLPEDLSESKAFLPRFCL